MSFQELLRKAEQALTSLDAETLVDCYAADFELDDVPSGSRINEKSKLRDYYDRLFSQPEVAFKEVSFFASGEKAAGEWTWNGRSKSGKKFAIRGASIFILEEDGIKSESLFYDPRPFYE